MSTRDMLTAIPPENSFASVVSIPLSLAIVFGGFWCLKAAIRLVRKPPPPNVVRASPRPIALGLVCAVVAVSIVPLIGLELYHRDFENAAIAIIVFVFVGPAGMLLPSSLSWAIEIEKDGIVLRTLGNSRRIAWAEIECVYLADDGSVICELGAKDRLVALRDAPNKNALLLAARKAGVSAEPRPPLQSDQDEDEEPDRAHLPRA